MLQKIISNKKKEIAALKKKRPIAALKEAVVALPPKKPRFIKALRKKRGMAVIAEIKKKSPSRGVLRKDFNVTRLASDYAAGGADALSVLTDERYFGGTSRDLVCARLAADLPILRKDFTIDPYQIYESRLLGADAVLLIAAVLSNIKLRGLLGLARRLGLDALVEVHSESELRRVLKFRPQLIGINNRDLKTFRVDTRTTERLAGLVPKSCVLVSESGIKTFADLRRLKAAGARAVLVGESLLIQKNVIHALRRLRGVSHGQG